MLSAALTASAEAAASKGSGGDTAGGFLCPNSKI